MLPNILITGCSGYLGGTLLQRLTLQRTSSPPHGHLYALVRNSAQASAIERYGAEPLTFDAYDAEQVMQNITQYRISVVFFLIDAVRSTSQEHFIRALEVVRKDSKIPVYFVHTSGAKMFSSHCGAPLDHSFSDADPDLYQNQKAQVAPIAFMQQPIETNNTVIDLGKLHEVQTYVFVPCIVYGKGEGFGNRISIQTTAIVRAAVAAGRVYRVQDGDPVWPVCHISDTVDLYMEMLRNILEAGRTAMAERGVIADATVGMADDDALARMAAGLECPKEMVAVSLSGCCRFAAARGLTIGWSPKFPAEHILAAIDEEVGMILSNQS